MNRLHVPARHRKNVRGAVDQGWRERLAAEIADIHSVFCTDLHRIQTWRLSPHRMNTGRKDFDIFAVAD